ncbi:hypothetical protein [Streptomyces rubiginosohelvolus]|uniref:hypothetical protein n=1 Tax=Streptomyces rubiginosohelvolus TaxID=67362 RepID=UPI0033BCACD1
MSTEQHDADAYGQELAAISHHQRAAHRLPGLGRRRDRARAGRRHRGEAGGRGGDPRPHLDLREQPAAQVRAAVRGRLVRRVRDVASYLLRIADTTAHAERGRAASSAMLVAHPQQLASPAPAAPEATAADEPAPASVPPLEAKDVLAAAERFPWAVAAPGTRHWPDGSDFLEAAPFLLRGRWEEELETVFLDDLEFVWRPRIRLSR